MSKKLGIVTLILCLIAVCLSVVALVKTTPPAAAPDAQEQEDVQYVLYLGTNDKDTNQPVFPADQAKEKAEEILLNHFGGYTIQDAAGGWVDDNTVYREYTLVIYLSDTTLADVHAAAEDMIREFNQSSVLIQANQTRTEFYSGEE